MVTISPKHPICLACGYRHRPGNYKDCIELLREELAAAQREIDRLRQEHTGEGF